MVTHLWPRMRSPATTCVTRSTSTNGQRSGQIWSIRSLSIALLRVDVPPAPDAVGRQPARAERAKRTIGHVVSDDPAPGLRDRAHGAPRSGRPAEAGMPDDGARADAHARPDDDPRPEDRRRSDRA